MKCLPFIQIFVSINTFHIFPFLPPCFILYVLGLNPGSCPWQTRVFVAFVAMTKHSENKKQLREGEGLFDLYFQVPIHH